MAGNYGANQYRQTQVKTANRGQLLILLYEAAIKNVKKASDCLDKKDLNGKGAAIIKTHDIINELVNTLDFNVGGNIARDLERLYNFMIEQLVKANAENNKQPLVGVIKLLENLLDGWRGAIAQVNKAQAGGTGTPTGTIK